MNAWEKALCALITLMLWGSGALVGFGVGYRTGYDRGNADGHDWALRTLVQVASEGGVK